jgi:hypothetical protein
MRFVKARSFTVIPCIRAGRIKKHWGGYDIKLDDSTEIIKARNPNLERVGDWLLMA